jgi:class 3 adenylate cyclase
MRGDGAEFAKKLLPQVPMLSFLSSSEIQAIAQRGEIVSVNDGDVLIAEGAVGNTLFLVLQGKVGISRDGFHLAVSETGSVVGEISIVDSGKATATVTAMGPLMVFKISKENFETLYSNENFVRAILKGLAAKTREALDRDVGNLHRIEGLRDTFGRYVSKAVLDDILSSSDPDSLLSGRVANATILFSDIRNFTAFSEHLSAADMIGLLRDYFGRMVPLVTKHNGYINKFIGDALLVLFNLPVAYANSAMEAARTAIEMSQSLDEMNAERRERGKPAISIGIGIHIGDVIAGNIGSVERMEYTVIGDNVNLCSRLEGLTKHYGVRVLISEDLREKLGHHFLIRAIDVVVVHGRQKPTRIYELRGTISSAREVDVSLCQQYEEALHLYFARRWRDCIENISDSKLLAQDNPSHVLRNRCEVFLKEPPSENWNGAFAMGQK